MRREPFTSPCTSPPVHPPPRGECGYRGGSCDFSKFDAAALQAAKNAVYARATRALNDAGIVPIYSLDNRIAASGNGTSAAAPCALPEDDLIAALNGTTWVRFYENWPQVGGHRAPTNVARTTPSLLAPL